MVRVPNLCVIEDKVLGQPVNLQLYAVLDGHGGVEVAQFASEQLQKNLERLVPLEVNSSVLTSAHGQDKLHSSSLAADTLRSITPDISESPRKISIEQHKRKEPVRDPVSAAMVAAFEGIDKELSNHQTLAETSKWVGTTATAVIVGPRHFWMAHAGDSRAVLCRRRPNSSSMLALPLTRDHKASCPIEAARIAEAGGAVLQNHGPRLMGILAVTRAIGDRALQSHGLTATPETRQMALTSDDQFLILASDGLWDVVSNQDAVDLVARVFERVEQRRNVSCPAACRIASNVLTRVALARGSEDNISVIVVDLRHRAHEVERSRLYASNSHDTRTPSGMHKNMSTWPSGSLETLFRSDGSLHARMANGAATSAVSHAAVQALAELVRAKGSKLQGVTSSGSWLEEGGVSPRSVSPEYLERVERGQAGGSPRGRVVGLVSMGSCPLGCGVLARAEVGCGQVSGRKRHASEERGEVVGMQKAVALVDVGAKPRSPNRCMAQAVMG